MLGRVKTSRFDELVLPHLDAAYNLARWLTRDDQDAEDVVQEACLRALTYFDGFRGSDARPWLLRIVRNTCYSWLRKRSDLASAEFDEDLERFAAPTETPETFALKSSDREMIGRALESLPSEYREVIVLREFEELGYKEIAEIAGIPVGTVMSRLARARQRLRNLLVQMSGEGARK